MNLLTLAPTILGFLGGPAGGLAGAALQWIAGKTGAKDSTVDAIKEALQGFKPEDTVALRKLDIEFQEFCMENNIKIDMAQIEVNKVEAGSESVFVAGWRPAVGWIGAFGFGYAAIVEPIFRFVAQVMFKYAGQFPTIDTMLTLQVLMGILGLGALRTADKKWGNGNEVGKH